MNQLYRFVKAGERLPEPYRAYQCKFTPPSPDPRKDTELHWGYVDKNDKWLEGWENNQVEWLEPLPVDEDLVKEAEAIYPLTGSIELDHTPDWHILELRKAHIRARQMSAREIAGEETYERASLERIRDFVESWKYKDAWREVYNIANDALNGR